MPTHARNPSRPHAMRLVLASLCASCVGTPTPDPPDYDPLPRPRDESFLREGGVRVATAIDSSSPLLTLPLQADARAVLAGSEVSLVNLDEPESAPVTVRAAEDGSFSTMVRGRLGQRIRLVYRTTTRHSLPLDLEITGNETSAAIVPAMPMTLDCLQIEPLEEITRAPTDSERHPFRVANRCTGEVTLERAELRFGDRGFRLTTPPDSIPEGGSAELIVLFPTHEDASERADIVLLEVESGGLRGRYALGVWSIPNSK